MASDNVFVIIVIATAVFVLAFLGLLLYVMSKMTQRERVEIAEPEMERRMIERENAYPSRRERLRLEKMLGEQLEAVQASLHDQETLQKDVIGDYEERYFKHVHVEGQDPDTFGLPLHMRGIRKNIKDLELQVVEREKEKTETIKERERLEQEERRLGHQKRGGGEMFSFASNILSDEAGEKEMEKKADDFLTDEFLKNVKLPTKHELFQKRMQELQAEMRSQRRVDAFYDMDKDLSGTLDIPEVQHRLTLVLRRPVEQEEVQELFKVMDADQDGLVTKEEFVAFCDADDTCDAEFWGTVKDGTMNRRLSDLHQANATSQSFPDGEDSRPSSPASSAAGTPRTLKLKRVRPEKSAAKHRLSGTQYRLQDPAKDSTFASHAAVHSFVKSKDAGKDAEFIELEVVDSDDQDGTMSPILEAITSPASVPQSPTTSPRSSPRQKRPLKKRNSLSPKVRPKAKPEKPVSKEKTIKMLAALIREQDDAEQPAAFCDV
ncbi:hypothetical protein DIPPA_14112 [Diplonema papillatum]|nr:hypothetical protein DIPPA_14112 [Diplonema papillatum]